MKYTLLKDLIKEQMTYKKNKREKLLLHHNLFPYFKVIKSFDDGHKRVAINHVMGTGKSYIAMQWLCDEMTGALVSSNQIGFSPIYVQSQKDMKVLYLSPKHAIFGQLQRHIDDMGVTELHNHIEFRTYSGLLSEFKKGKAVYIDSEDELALNDDEQNAFDNYVKQFTHIVLDEYHHADENKWGEAVQHALQCNAEAKVLGLSATPIRATGKNTTETLFDNNIVSTLTLADAIVREILPMPDYRTAVYSYDALIQKYEDRITQLTDVEKKERLTRCVNDIKRELLNAKSTKDILLEHFDLHKNGKFIFFCENIEMSEKYREDILNIIGDRLPVHAVYNVHSNNAKALEEIDAFSASKDNGLKLLFAVNMLNEGVHVKDVDGVVMLRDTQSFNVYYQQLGRALSAGSKRHPLVLDLVNNMNSFYEYQEDRQNVSSIFKEVADRSTNIEIQFMASQILKENKMMSYFQQLDKMLGTHALTTEFKLEVLKAMKVEYEKTGKEWDLNKIPNKETYTYQGETYKIGEWLSTAKKQMPIDHPFIVGLQELGFDPSYRKLKIVSHEFKLEIFRAMKNEYEKLEKEWDLNKIPQKQTYTYKGETYKIGAWLNAVKGRGITDQTFVEGLQELGFDPSYKQLKIVSNEFKLEILKTMKDEYEKLEKEWDLNKIPQKQTYTYKGESYNIGEWLRTAKKQMSTDHPFIVGLQELGFDPSYRQVKIVSNEFKLEVLKAMKDEYENAGKEWDINKIFKKRTYTYQGETYKIGLWLNSIKGHMITDQTFVEGLQELGFDPSYRHLQIVSNEFKLEVLKAMKDEYENAGKEWNMNQMSHKQTYTYEGKTYNIGIWLYTAKRGMITDHPFVEGLQELGFDPSYRKVKNVSNEFKLEVLKAMKDEYEKTGREWDVNKISKIQTYTYQGESYNIGIWLNTAKRRMSTDHPFVVGLQELGFVHPDDLEDTNNVENKLS